MRRWLALALLACLALGLAAGEGLEDNPAYSCWEDGVDTVWRGTDQPFWGTASEGSAVAYVDLVETAREGLLVPRLVLALEVEEPLSALELRLEIGRETRRAVVFPRTSEYDMLYQEDYSVWLVDGGTQLLQTMIRAKTSEFRFTLSGGGREITGTLTVPSSSLQRIWEDFRALRGDRQDFSALENPWQGE